MTDSRALLNIDSAFKVFSLVSKDAQEVIKLINSRNSCDEICQELNIGLDELSVLAKEIVDEYNKFKYCQDFGQLLRETLVA
jgi:hypothetical protein